MVQFEWNNGKNKRLKAKRGPCFEQVVLPLEWNEFQDIIEHPNPGAHPGQMIAVVRVGEHALLVPYLREGDTVFLKTIIPSRKATSKYRGK